MPPDHAAIDSFDFYFKVGTLRARSYIKYEVTSPFVKILIRQAFLISCHFFRKRVTQSYIFLGT
jgi:hypothetical protein